MDDTDDSFTHFLESTRFWVQRVFVPILVCIGIGGNTITVVVLTRKRMRCSTNIYLTALAVADIVYLLFVFFLSFKHYRNIDDGKYELYWRFFGLTRWLCDSASNTSVWLTVSFTVERYIAVCHPIKGKVLCTENRAKGIISLIALWCILTTVTTAFEKELVIKNYCMRNCTAEELEKMREVANNTYQNTTFHYLPHTNIIQNDQPSEKEMKDIINKLQPKIDKILPKNCTSHRHVIYVPIFTSAFNNSKFKDAQPTQLLAERAKNASLKVPVKNITITKVVASEEIGENDTCCLKKFLVTMNDTKLGENDIYQTFMSWYSALFFALIPLALIATFNCFLVHAVYKSHSKRRRMTNTQENVSMSNENRITVMLIGVVILFLICQTPTASFLIYSNFYRPKDEGTENIHLALGNIFNFLLTVNASTNFIMYCVFSKKYRTTFMSLFCGRKKQRQDTLMLSSTRSRNSTYYNGYRRNISEYRTPRNLETQSLTSIPRSKSLMTRLPGKAKSKDLIL